MMPLADLRKTTNRPLVLIDEAHFNYQLVEASDKPFAAFLQESGYRVSSLTVPFEKESLDTGQVLIIAMPLAERNRIHGNPDTGMTEDWSLPNPSAFSDHEIAVIKSWVVDGGSLLVIFDHMPFAGAVAELARAFGIEVSNGHARDSVTGPMIFSRSNGTLTDHVITNGISPAKRIESVAMAARHFLGRPGCSLRLLGRFLNVTIAATTVGQVSQSRIRSCY